MRNKRDFKIHLILILLIGLTVYLIIVSQSAGRERYNLRMATKDNTSRIEKLEAKDKIKSEDSAVKIVKGPKGEKGDTGDTPANGKDGKDAKPAKDGKDGDSAYDVAVKNGFIGSKPEWLESLKGADARTLDVTCLAGHLHKKFIGDIIWQPTRITCEED